jgi:molecular chaperone IbpA
MAAIFNATSLGSYPPYNIRTLGDDKFVLEIVAAGHNLGEFLIELEDRILTIQCTPEKPENNFMYQGLSYKKWFRQFTLTPGLVVKNAELVNGILRVLFDREAPIPKKLKINISQPTASSNPQLLNEDSVM